LLELLGDEQPQGLRVVGRELGQQACFGRAGVQDQPVGD
jgi:hypothetical protein